MNKDFSFSPHQPNQLEQRIDELRAILATRDPQQLAYNTAASYTSNTTQSGFFQFAYWQVEIQLSYPSFIATSVEEQKELGIANQALILYYFLTARPQSLMEKWISFAELPEGRFYNQAFQGYTGTVLIRHFGDHIERLEQAVLLIKGTPYPFGDRAFLFWVLPRVPLLLVYWQGDEDFQPSYQILFDASVTSYLPTDACAIAGSMLTRKLTSN
jgi:hypothetical protein